MVHSLGKYFDEDGNPALQGKIICFAGDRSPDGEPNPMVLPEQTTWTWKEAIINKNAAAAATFFSDPTNRQKAWEPSTQRDKVKVPRFLYLGTELGEWASRELHTPFEHHKHIDNVLSADSGAEGEENAADDASAIKLWALSMAQRCGSSKKPHSNLSISPTPVFNPDPAFTKWCNSIITSTLGPSQRLLHPTPVQPSTTTAPTGQGATELLAEQAKLCREMLQELKDTRQQGAPATSTAGGKDTGGRVYTAHQMAAIKGFSGTLEVTELSTVWPKWQKTKDVDDHRVILRGEMEAFADKNKIELDAGLFYSKEAMDDMVRVRMNGTEGFPSLRSAERGCSIFADFPRTSDAIESLRLQEHAAEVSQANHSFAEALQLAASDGRTPPETYMEMRLVIGTYAAKLWALWRGQCHHFQKVFAIYNTLLLPEVMAIKAAFTPKVIREIVWAIFDDGRCFFNQRRSPEDLSRTPINWPASTLDDILLDVRFA